MVVGMYDSVYADCPRCGKSCEFQSKAGDCCLDTYTLDNAPAEILLDIINEPNWCAGCKSWFALIDPKFPPEPAVPVVNPQAKAVREPEEGEYWCSRLNPDRWRYWDTEFKFEDLV